MLQRQSTIDKVSFGSIVEFAGYYYFLVGEDPRQSETYLLKELNGHSTLSIRGKKQVKLPLACFATLGSLPEGTKFVPLHTMTTNPDRFYQVVAQDLEGTEVLDLELRFHTCYKPELIVKLPLG